MGGYCPVWLFDVWLDGFGNAKNGRLLTEDRHNPIITSTSSFDRREVFFSFFLWDAWHLVWQWPMYNNFSYLAWVCSWYRCCTLCHSIYSGNQLGHYFQEGNAWFDGCWNHACWNAWKVWRRWTVMTWDEMKCFDVEHIWNHVGNFWCIARRSFPWNWDIGSLSKVVSLALLVALGKILRMYYLIKKKQEEKIISPTGVICGKRQ